MSKEETVVLNRAEGNIAVGEVNGYPLTFRVRADHYALVDLARSDIAGYEDIHAVLNNRHGVAVSLAEAALIWCKLEALRLDDHAVDHIDFDGPPVDLTVLKLSTWTAEAEDWALFTLGGGGENVIYRSGFSSQYDAVRWAEFRGHTVDYDLPECLLMADAIHEKAARLREAVGEHPKVEWSRGFLRPYGWGSMLPHVVLPKDRLSQGQARRWSFYHGFILVDSEGNPVEAEDDNESTRI